MDGRRTILPWITVLAALMQFAGAAWVCTFAFNDARTLAYARSLYAPGQAWIRFCDLYDVVDAELHTFFFVPMKRSPDALPLRQAVIERDQVLNKLFDLGGPEHIAPLRDEISWRGFLLRYALVELRPTAYGSLLEWRTWWEWLKAAGAPEGLIKLALLVSLELLMACSLIYLLAQALAPLCLSDDDEDAPRSPRLVRWSAAALLFGSWLLALPCLPVAFATAEHSDSRRSGVCHAFFACSAGLVGAFGLLALLLFGCDAVDGLVCWVCIHWLTPECFQQAMGGLGPLSFWLYIILYYVINFFWAAFRLFTFLAKRLALAAIFVSGLVQFLIYTAVSAALSDPAKAILQNQSAAAAKPTRADAVRSDQERLQGFWVLDRLSIDGRTDSFQFCDQATLTVDEDEYVPTQGTMIWGCKFKLDPSKQPRTLDLEHLKGANAGGRQLAIYKFESDGSLTICAAENGDARPSDFSSRVGRRQMVLYYRRPTPHEQEAIDGRSSTKSWTTIDEPQSGVRLKLPLPPSRKAGSPPGLQLQLRGNAYTFLSVPLSQVHRNEKQLTPSGAVEQAIRNFSRVGGVSVSRRPIVKPDGGAGFDVVFEKDGEVTRGQFLTAHGWIHQACVGFSRSFVESVDVQAFFESIRVAGLDRSQGKLDGGK